MPTCACIATSAVMSVPSGKSTFSSLMLEAQGRLRRKPRHLAGRLGNFAGRASWSRIASHLPDPQQLSARNPLRRAGADRAAYRALPTATIAPAGAHSVPPRASRPVLRFDEGTDRKSPDRAWPISLRSVRRTIYDHGASPSRSSPCSVRRAVNVFIPAGCAAIRVCCRSWPVTSTMPGDLGMANLRVLGDAVRERLYRRSARSRPRRSCVSPGILRSSQGRPRRRARRWKTPASLASTSPDWTPAASSPRPTSPCARRSATTSPATSARSRWALPGSI